MFLVKFPVSKLRALSLSVRFKGFTGLIEFV